MLKQLPVTTLTYLGIKITQLQFFMKGLQCVLLFCMLQCYLKNRNGTCKNYTWLCRYDFVNNVTKFKYKC